MNTQDLFKNNRSSKRLNESLSKTFGQKIDFQSFDTPKLEDARNKLRTQIYTARTNSGFNETIENEALTKAQWMHDAIVAELMNREEHIVDGTVQEGTDIDKMFDQWMNSEDAPMDDESGDERAVFTKAMRFLNGQVPEDDIESYAEELADRFHGGTYDDEGGETDDSYALASAGFGSDEDYGDFGSEHESVEVEGSENMSIGQQMAKDGITYSPEKEDELIGLMAEYMKKDGMNSKAIRYYLNYDEDFIADQLSELPR